MKHELKIGDLLLRRDDGKPALVIGMRDSRKAVYGDTARKRKIYRIFDEGREYWIHDIELPVKFVINP